MVYTGFNKDVYTFVVCLSVLVKATAQLKGGLLEPPRTPPCTGLNLSLKLGKACLSACKKQIFSSSPAYKMCVGKVMGM